MTHREWWVEYDPASCLARHITSSPRFRLCLNHLRVLDAARGRAFWLDNKGDYLGYLRDCRSVDRALNRMRWPTFDHVPSASLGPAAGYIRTVTGTLASYFCGRVRAESALAGPEVFVARSSFPFNSMAWATLSSSSSAFKVSGRTFGVTIAWPPDGSFTLID